VVPASASDAHSNAHHDLRNEDGWDDLGGDLEDLAEGYEDEGERWMALYHSVPIMLSVASLGRNAITYPHCLSQAVREILRMKWSIYLESTMHPATIRAVHLKISMTI